VKDESHIASKPGENRDNSWFSQSTPSDSASSREALCDAELVLIAKFFELLVEWDKDGGVEN
jgi:hypothetical protein